MRNKLISMRKVILKIDSFKKTRGNSKLLKLYWRKCNGLVGIYQKGGPGNLRRLYIDRFFSPKNLLKIHSQKISAIPDLKCKSCKEILGISYLYKKENLKAFRLFQDAVIERSANYK